MGALKELGFSSRGASAELNENSDNENLMYVGCRMMSSKATY